MSITQEAGRFVGTGVLIGGTLEGGAQIWRAIKDSQDHVDYHYHHFLNFDDPATYAALLLATIGVRVARRTGL